MDSQDLDERTRMLNGPKGKIKSGGGVRKRKKTGFFVQASPFRASGRGMRHEFAIRTGRGKT